MKRSIRRAMILTASLIAICLVAIWWGNRISRDIDVLLVETPHAPIDVVIDHIPMCAQGITHGKHQLILTGVERGVCTTRNVIRN